MISNLIILFSYILGFFSFFFVIDWMVKRKYNWQIKLLIESFQKYFEFNDFYFFVKEKKYYYFWSYYFGLVINLSIGIAVWFAMRDISDFFNNGNWLLIISGIIILLANSIFIIGPYSFWKKLKAANRVVPKQQVITKFNSFLNDYIASSDTYIKYIVLKNNQKWKRNFTISNYDKRIARKIKRVCLKKDHNFALVNIFISYFANYSFLLDSFQKEFDNYTFEFNNQSNSIEEFKKVLINNFFYFINVGKNKNQ